MWRGGWTARVEFAPGQHRTEEETVHVLWATTGLGCDGDSLAMTSATSPSLEDILLGAIPGTPRVVLHNPVLAFESGEDFMDPWYAGRGGRARSATCWSSRARSATRRSTARATGAGWASTRSTASRSRSTSGSTGSRRGPPPCRDRDLRHLRRHPGDEEQPDRGDGAARLPGLEVEVAARACRSSASPAAPRSPTT